MATICLLLGIIVVLVALANRIGVAWPSMLVLGGMLIGYIPSFPTIAVQPDRSSGRQIAKNKPVRQK